MPEDEDSEGKEDTETSIEVDLDQNGTPEIKLKTNSRIVAILVSLIFLVIAMIGLAISLAYN